MIVRDIVFTDDIQDLLGAIMCTHFRDVLDKRIGQWTQYTSKEC